MSYVCLKQYNMYICTVTFKMASFCNFNFGKVALELILHVHLKFLSSMLCLSRCEPVWSSIVMRPIHKLRLIEIYSNMIVSAPWCFSVGSLSYSIARVITSSCVLFLQKKLLMLFLFYSKWSTWRLIFWDGNWQILCFNKI